MELVPTPPTGDDEPGLFEHVEVLRYRLAARGQSVAACQADADLKQGLSAPLLQLVEDRAPGRIGQGPEDVAHTGMIGKWLVACKTTAGCRESVGDCERTRFLVPAELALVGVLPGLKRHGQIPRQTRHQTLDLVDDLIALEDLEFVFDRPDVLHRERHRPGRNGDRRWRKGAVAYFDGNRRGRSRSGGAVGSGGPWRAGRAGRAAGGDGEADQPGEAERQDTTRQH